MHDVRLLHDSRNHKGALRRTADVYPCVTFLFEASHRQQDLSKLKSNLKMLPWNKPDESTSI